MKKEYIMPTMRIVVLRHKAHLLSGSFPETKKVDVYQDEIRDEEYVM